MSHPQTCLHCFPTQYLLNVLWCQLWGAPGPVQKKARHELLHCLPELGVRYSEPLHSLLLLTTTSGFIAFYRFLPVIFKDRITQRTMSILPGLAEVGKDKAESCCRAEAISLCPDLDLLLTILQPISFSPHLLPQICTA